MSDELHGHGQAHELDDNGRELARFVLAGPAVSDYGAANVRCGAREGYLCALHGPRCPQLDTEDELQASAAPSAGEAQ
jgi:hypothetical protein